MLDVWFSIRGRYKEIIDSEIARTAIQVFDTNGPDEENPLVVAKVFYDENESYVYVFISVSRFYNA